MEQQQFERHECSQRSYTENTVKKNNGKSGNAKNFNLPLEDSIESSVEIVHDQGASNINCSSSFYDHDVILLVLLTICPNLASLTL